MVKDEKYIRLVIDKANRLTSEGYRWYLSFYNEHAQVLIFVG